jgi:hypothetical protein
VQIRVLTAGLVLLAVGCSLFWFSSRHSQTPARATNPGLFGQGRTGSSIPQLVPDREVSAQELSSKAPSLLAGLPLYFEPNQGQGNLDSSDARAKFVSRGAGYSLFLGSNGAILSLASHEPKKKGSSTHGNQSTPNLEFLHMKLAGSNPQARLRATDSLPGKSNYFIGNDPSKWRTGVPHFARVRYENVYPGINLVFYGREGHLEYDFQVAPGSDPGQAELEFDGVKKLELKDGALLIHARHGSVALQAPRVYQEIAGQQQAIAASFVLRGNHRAGFAIAPYDRSRELIIDPVLNFATYFGGTGDELNNFVAVDGNLNIYLAGSTTSASLPGITTGSLQQTLKGAQNVYIAKITPPLGSIAATLDDVTYLGGSGTDSPVGIQVDGGDNPYLAGTTSSTDFPTTATNAYQSTIYSGSTGTTHVFVTRIQSDFTALHYSSYLSGNGTDTASAMTIDSAANLFVTGTTTSNNVANAGAGIQFPASTSPNIQAFQQISNAAIQFFVTKVNTNNSRFTSIPYSTYFGGANFTPPTGSTLPIATGGGIAVDTNQNAYFTGTTNFTFTGSTVGDFPILNAYQPCLNSPPAAVILPPQSCSTQTDPTIPDAFAAKLSTTNVSPTQQLVWSTYIGGTGTDSGAGIALDTGAANVYVVGTTNSQDFVNTAFVSTFASFQRCLNNMPPTPSTGVVTCTVQTNPPNDAFVARITNPTITSGSTTTVALNYFSYLGGAANVAGLGGSGEETGNAITVDSNSGAVITGSTQSAFSAGVSGTFPLTPNPSSIQSQLTETQAAFIARLNTTAVSGQTTTASWATYFGGNCNPQAVPPCTPPDSFISSGTGIALDVNQDTYVSGDTNSPYLLVAKPLAQNTTLTGGYDAFVTQLGAAVSLSISGVLGLGTNQSFIAAGNPATFTYTITNSGPDLASNITILANLSQASTFVPLTNITGSISTGTCGAGSTGTGISCGPISLQAGSTATLTITATPTANSSGAAPQAFNGGTIQVVAPGNIVLTQTSVPAQMSDFKMTASPLNQSVPQAGTAATYTVSLTPQPLFGSPITLSCTGTPSGSSCAFNPSTSVTLQSSSGSTVTLTIPTTARPVTPAASLFKRPFYALWLAIPGIAFLGIGGDRRRRKIVGISMLCTIFALLLLVPACSHSTTQTPVSGTPAGTYTITVTASSGTNSKSQNITLTVP